MSAESVFEIDIQYYSIRQLTHHDVEELQRLFEKCRDYFQIVEGQEPASNVAEEAFQSVPPGKSKDDKLMFGIVNDQDKLVGLLDCVRRYPNEATWWIGLFIILPECRSRAIGQKVIHGFEKFVRAHGGESIMLGVVDENKRAFEFWKKLNFDVVRRTEPRMFGRKTQAVVAMRKNLLGAACP